MTEQPLDANRYELVFEADGEVTRPADNDNTNEETS